MLGLATGTELRLALYGVLLAAIGGWLVYEHHHLIAEGEQAIITQDKAAAERQQAAIALQVQHDKDASDTATAALQSELASLRATPAPGARFVRCFSSNPGAVPSKAAAPGSTQPAHATPGDLGPVPPVGVDLEPVMRLTTEAGAVAAAYQIADASFVNATR